MNRLILRRAFTALAVAGLLAGTAACGSDDGTGVRQLENNDCATTGKCDLPDDPAEVSCTKRRADAYTEARSAFTEGFLRWSCADVAGVTEDDRGQEYCEYFAIAQLPPDGTNPAPP